jgi:hypothetical protein
MPRSSPNLISVLYGGSAVVGFGTPKPVGAILKGRADLSRSTATAPFLAASWRSPRAAPESVFSCSVAETRAAMGGHSIAPTWDHALKKIQVPILSSKPQTPSFLGAEPLNFPYVADATFE